MNGLITNVKNQPLQGIRVVSLDKDLRGEAKVGEQVSGLDGRYEIHYSSQQFSRADKQKPHLFFKLFYPTGEEIKNYTSKVESGMPVTVLDTIDDSDKGSSISIIYNASNEQRVDFKVLFDTNRVSEYETIVAELEPLLVNINTGGPAEIATIDRLTDLKNDEFDFLSRATGIDRMKIEYLVAALLLQREIKDLRQQYTLSSGVFYGLARTRGATSFPGLARLGVADLKSALMQAAGLKEDTNSRIIPPFESEEKLNEAAEFIHYFAIQIFLSSKTLDNKQTISQLLSLTLSEPKDQAEFLKEFFNHKGTIKEFWSKLRQHPQFHDQNKVDKLQFTLQLGVLTRDNLKVMNAMMNEFQSTREIASYNEEEFKSFIKDVLPDLPADYSGDTQEEKLELYAKKMIGTIQGAFPTETVAQVISKDPYIQSNGISNMAISLFLNLATDSNFIPKAEEFHIGSTHIDTFIHKHGEKIFKVLGDDIDRAKLIVQLKRAQRLFQVSTSPETFQLLMESKINSANDIARKSLPSLVEEFGDRIDSSSLDLMHRRAVSISAAGLHIALQAYQSVTEAHPMVIGQGLKELPDWATFFGSLEMCDCEHCRSVYSPAAYLVDLLQFLSNSTQNEEGWTPLDILIGNRDNPDPSNQILGKRPDLAHIPLTCENTNVPIPYIDLVNEVLESYVALGGHLNKTTAKDTGDTTPEEQLSNPQYVEESTYDILREAVFPISLPFDRSLEISRLYLGHLGSSRYDLMATFGTANRNQLSCEYLGITEKEFEIQVGKDFQTQPSPISLDDLYAYEDENLVPTLVFDPTFEPDEIMTGIAVVILQAKLNTDGAQPQLTLSGRYDQVTQDAVKEFQNRHRLTIDGIVDNDDWNVLMTIKPDAVGVIVTPVPEFLKRTKLSYIELVELLKTRFINPSRQALARLEDAGITYGEIRTLIESEFTDIDPALQDKMTQAGLSLDVVRQIVEQAIHTIIIYTDRTDCDLDASLFQYLNGDSVDDVDLWKIQRFIRLWRKLGWTIPELDAVLISLGYTETIDENCIFSLSQVKFLQAKLKIPITRLTSLWSDIDTYGENSLYKRLFLNKAKLDIDDAFLPQPDGTILGDENHMITGDHHDHVPTLLAAFQISSTDLELILADLNIGGDASNTSLTLSNVSSLYRYGELAKALKIKVDDLLILKTLIGRNPFKAGIPNAVVEFKQIVDEVRSSDFSIRDLNYLYRHILGPNFEPAPNPDEVALLLKYLVDGLKAISQENKIPSGLETEMVRNKLAMIVDAPVADQAIQIILATGVTRAVFLAELPSEIKFPESVKKKISYLAGEKKLQFAGLMTPSEQTALIDLDPNSNYQAAINNLFQQSMEFIQQSKNFFARNLSSLFDLSDMEDQLLNSSVDNEGNLATGLSKKFSYIMNNLTPYLTDKFSRSFIKQTLGDNLKMDGAVTQVLLERTLKASTDENEYAIADFLALVGDGLLGEYFDNTTFADPPVATRVDQRISFKEGANFPHESIDHTKPFSVRWTGKIFAEFDEDYTFFLHRKGTLELWIDDQLVTDQGTITLKASQLYDIRVEYVRVNPRLEAFVELQWSSNPSTPKAVVPQTQLYSSKSFKSFELPMKSYYLLHKASLLINTLKINAKELTYLSLHQDDFAGADPTDPTRTVPFDLNRLLPLDPSGFEPAHFEQWRRLVKLFEFVKGLPINRISLTDVFGFASTFDSATNKLDKSILDREIIKELAVTASQNPDFASLLSTWLPVTKAVIKQILQNDWTGLSDATIKDQITIDTHDLTIDSHFINLLAKMTDLMILILMLTRVTGWDIKQLNELLVLNPQILNLTLPSFKDERSIIALQACIKLTRRLGVSSDKLFRWGTEAPNSDQYDLQVQDIKNMLKAKYDEENWLSVARQLNDKLRESQKTALIAYVLAMTEIRRANVKDSNQLFEYFLIDVEMGACMTTSRIKQAISSVQLFVQRCLLNLESGVKPSAIDVRRWQWMKNYRIWEANCKVFLYPENWIEPELRDDKSVFFKELESELLQNDLTNEVAEKTLLNYLFKLDQVARLEICGMYMQEDFEQDENYESVLHVFGRTMGGATRTHYYRRLINNKTWTSWEKVELDIKGLQGDDSDYSPRGSIKAFSKPQNGINLLPVVWNRRLYLFWLILTKRMKLERIPDSVNPNATISIEKPKPYWEIRLAWSNYDHGKWKPKQVSEETIEHKKDNVLIDPNLFRLRGLVGEVDGSIELHVFAEEKHWGKYRFENQNDNAKQFDDDKGTGLSEIQPALASVFPDSVVFQYFMSYIANNQLILKYPGMSTDVPILDLIPGRETIERPKTHSPTFTLLSLNQFLSQDQSLSAPYFYQDHEGVYFIRSAVDSEMIVRQVKDPDIVNPPIFEKSIDEHPIDSPLNIRDELFPPIPDPIMNKTVKNPWISAEQKLAPQRLRKICDQLGGVML